MNYSFNDATVLNHGDKLVIFTSDDLSRDEVVHLQEMMWQHLPGIEVVIVVGIAGVVVSRANAQEEEDAL